MNTRLPPIKALLPAPRLMRVPTAAEMITTAFRIYETTLLFTDNPGFSAFFISASGIRAIIKKQQYYTTKNIIQEEAEYNKYNTLTVRTKSAKLPVK